VKVSEILALVEEMVELRRAVGKWPWRTAWIEATRDGSDGKVSLRMRLMLALVIFEGYELFPAKKSDGCPPRT